MSKKEAINKLLSNRRSTGIQEYVNEGLQEPVPPAITKATFDFDSQFHADLKVFAANQRKPMVYIVVLAVKEYMTRNK